MTTRRTALAALAAGASALCGCGRPVAGPTAGRPGAASTGATPTASGVTSAGAATSAGAPVPPPGPDIQHGPQVRPVVALTFHGAGDPAVTRDVVAELARTGSRMTVLAIGSWLAAEPGIARRLLDAGHELGNHTWSHPTLPRLSPSAVEVEVRRAAAELRSLTGSIGRWFRPSGTRFSTPAIRAAATRAGYGACLSYDVDPLDYTDPGTEAVVQRVLAGAGRGAIVSLHLGHPQTRDALPAILDGLTRRGLRAVTVSDLLALG